MGEEVKKWLKTNGTGLKAKVTNIGTIVSILYGKDLISAPEKELILNNSACPTSGEKWDKISDLLISKSDVLSMIILKEIFNSSENYHIITVYFGPGQSQAQILPTPPGPDAGDFTVQNHHCVTIALKLVEVPRLKDNWDLICEEILTPKEISNLEGGNNFETKIQRTIQAWVLNKRSNASYNLLIKKIKDVNEPAAEELENIRGEVSSRTK